MSLAKCYVLEDKYPFNPLHFMTFSSNGKFDTKYFYDILLAQVAQSEKLIKFWEAKLTRLPNISDIKRKKLLSSIKKHKDKIAKVKDESPEIFL